MSANDGGPAFPFFYQGPTTGPEVYYGMSLRDHFAGLAMAVRWDDVNGREDQATKVITGLLREVDPNISIDGLDPVDEHESIEQ